MSISPKFLEEIKNRLALSEVIGRRIKVQRAGREFKACCPFHSEKSPSFTINDDKQFFHCFGCQAHGDVIGFVMRHDNLSFNDTVEMLAAEAGLQVPKQSPQEVKKAREEKDLYSLMEEATRFFENGLQNNSPVMRYLQNRGLTFETIRAFRIGYAPENGQDLRKYLLGKGYTDAQMIEASLVKRSARGGEPYTFFRERVMFPVPDRRGRLVAFGGRVLPEDLRAPARGDFVPPKYINSSETPLFHKGSMLYGEPHARKASADGQNIVVVEGYMDVIACVQAGINGALAPMGTALTEDQIAVLWKMIPTDEKVPILCFDGDNAGRNAASKAVDKILPLLRPNHTVRLAFLPEGEDPDSLIRAGGTAAIARVLESAIPLFDFLWNSHIAGREFKTPESRAGIIRVLEVEISRISDRDVQTHYRALLKERISETFFSRPARGEGPKAQTSMKMPGLKIPAPAAQHTYVYPRVLLAAVVNHPEIYDQVEEAFVNFTISAKTLGRFRQSIIGLLSENPELSQEELVKNLLDLGFKQEISDILSESVYVHASFCAPYSQKETVAQHWLTYWKDGNKERLKKEIRAGWKEAFIGSSEQEEEKLRQIMGLRDLDEAG